MLNLTSSLDSSGRFSFTKEKVVVAYFGCFNPPTYGHIHAATISYDFLCQKGFDVLKVVIIPAHSQYGKPGLLDPMTRVQMCKIATEGMPFLEVDDVEAKLDHWSRSIDTIHYLKDKYKARVIMLCGIDLVEQFDTKWREPDVIQIITEGIIVLPRQGYDTDIEKASKFIPGRLENIFLIPENPLSAISSTLIRTKIRENEHIFGLIPLKLIDFINEHQYYRT